jgi:hypothetical protein
MGALRRLQGGMESGGIKLIRQRLHTQAAEQLDGLGGVLRGRKHHGAEPARVVQPQGTRGW